MKTVLIIVLILALAMVGGLFYLGSSSASQAPVLGVSNNEFVPCPDTPNCRSSDASDDGHAYPAFTLTAGANWSSVVDQVKGLPGLTVIEDKPDYLRAEVRSSIFGFVDDLEVHQRGNQLAVRSASRVGKSDLGANAKRLDELKARLQAAELIN